MFKVNKKNSKTNSLYVFLVSLFIFKHIAHIALEFSLLSLSRSMPATKNS